MTQPNWIDVARIVMLSRAMDRLEVEQLAPQGKVKYQFSAGGHELAQALLAQALDHPHDAATVYYRSRPFLLANGLTPAEALAAGMAKLNSPSHGRDVGVVFNMPRRQRATILPASGDVGAQYTPAAGWAQAIDYRSRVLEDAAWQNAVAVACGGDGSVAANGFWAALNIAAPLRLPMIFCIEDNQYGISVPAHMQTPNGNISANLATYGNLYTIDADGADPADAWQAIRQAVERARAGEGPVLLHLRVPRLGGHTFVDTQAYKPADLRAQEAARDPLPRLRGYLIENGHISEGGWENLHNEVQEALEQALQVCLDGPEPDPADTCKHIFFMGEAPRQGGLRPEGFLPQLGKAQAQPIGARLNLIDAVRRTLEHEMRLNPRLLVFGEDVGLKGGVHGATQDLQASFGEARVFDTSLSEDGIIGRAVGMALAGLLPVPEIQFRKYADPATEQINDLGTLRWRTANNFAAPVVVRIPVGYSKKTGDPWHSVSGEAIYAHTPGWRIAYPSNAEDAVGLLRTALRSDDPTFFFEHRALLDGVEARRPYPGDEYCLPFGQAARLLTGERLTVVTWGGMTPRCLEAAASLPGQIDLLDLRTIVPWDEQAVLESVQRTGRLLVVHEDTITTGFGAEIIARVIDQVFTSLDAPPQRLAPIDVPVPYNVNLMQHMLPSEAVIKAKMEECLSW